ncbi:MAG TPA: SRPBCC family protein [Aeromicrobium sp.]|nr:SRPBCC family protein [Aeromicrobium sp.]
MSKIGSENVTDARLEDVFAYIADSSNVPQWFYGVQHFEPLTEMTRGLGSKYAITLNVGRPVTARFECTEFEENELIAVQTFEGPHASSRWTFHREGTGTRIRGDFDYTLPGGVAGAALGRLLKPFLAVAIKQTMANLLKHAGR